MASEDRDNIYGVIKRRDFKSLEGLLSGSGHFTLIPERFAKCFKILCAHSEDSLIYKFISKVTTAANVREIIDEKYCIMHSFRRGSHRAVIDYLGHILCAKTVDYLRRFCSNGELEPAKAMYNHFGEGLCLDNMGDLLFAACEREHLKIADWLYSLRYPIAFDFTTTCILNDVLGKLIRNTNFHGYRGHKWLIDHGATITLEMATQVGHPGAADHTIRNCPEWQSQRLLAWTYGRTIEYAVQQSNYRVASYYLDELPGVEYVREAFDDYWARELLIDVLKNENSSAEFMREFMDAVQYDGLYRDLLNHLTKSGCTDLVKKARSLI
jgi:hypothetical protein